MHHLAIFVSGSGTNCDNIIRYFADRQSADVCLVVSNRADAYALVRARRLGVETAVVDKQSFNDPKVMLPLLKRHNIDFIVLARYMQVLSTDFIERYPNRIINIHHSFLPAFVGAKPYHAAYERGVKLIGATSHYVTTELDAGPIIEQDIVRITHKDTVADLVHKGRDLEKIVLSRAVEKHIQRKILAYKNKTIVFS